MRCHLVLRARDGISAKSVDRRLSICERRPGNQNSNAKRVSGGSRVIGEPMRTEVRSLGHHGTGSGLLPSEVRRTDDAWTAAEALRLLDFQPSATSTPRPWRGSACPTLRSSTATSPAVDLTDAAERRSGFKHKDIFQTYHHCLKVLTVGHVRRMMAMLSAENLGSSTALSAVSEMPGEIGDAGLGIQECLGATWSRRLSSEI